MHSAGWIDHNGVAGCSADAMAGISNAYSLIARGLQRDWERRRAGRQRVSAQGRSLTVRAGDGERVTVIAICVAIGIHRGHRDML